MNCMFQQNDLQSIMIWLFLCNFQLSVQYISCYIACVYQLSIVQGLLTYFIVMYCLDDANEGNLNLFRV